MFKQTCTHLAKLPKEQVQQWLNGFETVICDADGVLWSFEKAFEGAVVTFNHLRSLGKRMFVVTNNTTMVTEELTQKANKFGIKLDESEMINASSSIANFLAEKNFQKKVYLVGEHGVSAELAKLNICCSGLDKEIVDIPLKQFAEELTLDSDVGAVVVGKDDNFTVPKMIRASCYLKSSKVLFLATCLDAAYPVGNNRVLVGAGPIVAAMKSMSLRKPLVLGKPNPWMVHVPQKTGAMKPETTLMIGDTLYTDILFANNCGFQSLLVGTGVSSLKDVHDARDSDDKKKLALVPDTYLPSFSALLEYLC